ncbi:hypothetical protein ABB37_09655 [Leptomonas pyrrhocoris]|uniref:Uncharacterized protein n=1 Tax=Leptomonas pyrrhocoris TaxID=157538 RepID=A0A0N0DQZ9_LEPPY|nr:hypothetical protein ABB37_09655 [Leptomonas pyrrhocoris]KPA73761.1 hypothetical protein ABB37_09655 [Leptomonas pyrrhocoris]|eukprot:XP_015652200.1 hypothetical protein ABB37_09655 [Leptomonas pyrrhocoris]
MCITSCSASPRVCPWKIWAAAAAAAAGVPSPRRHSAYPSGPPAGIFAGCGWCTRQGDSGTAAPSWSSPRRRRRWRQRSASRARRWRSGAGRLCRWTGPTTQSTTPTGRTSIRQLGGPACSP